MTEHTASTFTNNPYRFLAGAAIAAILGTACTAPASDATVQTPALPAAAVETAAEPATAPSTPPPVQPSTPEPLSPPPAPADPTAPDPTVPNPPTPDPTVPDPPTPGGTVPPNPPPPTPATSGIETIVAASPMGQGVAVQLSPCHNDDGGTPPMDVTSTSYDANSDGVDDLATAYRNADGWWLRLAIANGPTSAISLYTPTGASWATIGSLQLADLDAPAVAVRRSNSISALADARLFATDDDGCLLTAYVGRTANGYFDPNTEQIKPYWISITCDADGTNVRNVYIEETGDNYSFQVRTSRLESLASDYDDQTFTETRGPNDPLVLDRGRNTCATLQP